jgi:septum formation protein
MGIDFTKVSINCEESYGDEIPSSEVAEFLACKKAEAYELLADDDILITADTTVLYHDRILNKPVDTKEAFCMLTELSGNVHSVVTGVCIRSVGKMESFSCVTKVSVDNISDDEVNFYINTYHPMDKAGAYGIQEWFGMTQIKSIEGCYFNVVGLPCNELFKRLKNDYGV